MKLTDKFSVEDVSWKILQNSWNDGKPYALMTPFVNASAIQERLDSVLGWENWKTEYEVKESGSYKYVVCILSCRTEKGEWISKQNVCEITEKKEESNAPDNPIKSAYSGAFKRVALEFGIGRYLKNIKKFSPRCCEEFPEGEIAIKCFDKRAINKNGKQGKSFYAIVPILEEENPKIETPSKNETITPVKKIEKKEATPTIKNIVDVNSMIGTPKAKEIKNYLISELGSEAAKLKIKAINHYFNCNDLSLITYKNLLELKKYKFDLEKLAMQSQKPA